MRLIFAVALLIAAGLIVWRYCFHERAVYVSKATRLRVATIAAEREHLALMQDQGQPAPRSRRQAAIGPMTTAFTREVPR